MRYGNILDGGNSAFSNRVLVKTNLEASKTLYLMAFELHFRLTEVSEFWGLSAGKATEHWGPTKDTIQELIVRNYGKIWWSLQKYFCGINSAMFSERDVLLSNQFLEMPRAGHREETKKKVPQGVKYLKFKTERGGLPENWSFQKDPFSWNSRDFRNSILNTKIIARTFQFWGN